jgi:hypothetical protein
VRFTRLAELASKIFNEKELEIDLNEMIEVATSYLRISSTKGFSSTLRRLFASEEKDKIFEDSNFELELPDFTPNFSKPFRLIQS